MAKHRVARLSATANPIDPFTQENSWRAYDNLLVLAGIIPLGCDEYFARIVETNDSMSEPEYLAECERAIDAIVEADPLNSYKKVVAEVDD